MIYKPLRAIVKFTLRIFFRKILVTGKENIIKNGPLIIAANHPNTLIDPLIIASLLPQQIGFIANASLFKNKIIAAIFKVFNVIPVYRKTDVEPGEKPDNRFAFSKCHEFLDKAGTFLIFPEGTSIYELKLREIKTGTARIALSYEELKGFGGNLKLLPISLDYSDSIKFRSLVSVSINKPIKVSDYQESFELNEYDSVNKLTEEVRMELEKNIPHTEDKEQEEFLKQAHAFYTEYVDPASNMFKNPKVSLEVRRNLSFAMIRVFESRKELYISIKEKLGSFFEQLSIRGLSPGFLNQAFLKKNPVWVSLGFLISLILLLPFYLLGLVTNYIPYKLPALIFKAMKIDIEYRTSVALVAGILLFPLYYFLILKFFSLIFPLSFWEVFGLIVLFSISGFITLFYYAEMKRFRRVLRYYLQIPKSWKTEMYQSRDGIIHEFREAQSILE